MNADDDDFTPCGYSLSCGNAATVVIPMGPAVGTITVCPTCAALYERLMSR